MASKTVHLHLWKTAVLHLAHFTSENIQRSNTLLF